MSLATAPSPMLTASDALAAAYAPLVAELVEVVRHCRAFVADLQTPADPEARELLGEIDRVLGVRS